MYVIYSDDPEFISFFDVPRGTDKVYFEGLSLALPPHIKEKRREELILQIAGTENPREIFEQGAERVYNFTHDVDEAMRWTTEEKERMEDCKQSVAPHIASNKGLKHIIVEGNGLPF